MIQPRTNIINKCPLCKHQHYTLMFSTPDKLHGVAGIYSYQRCNECKTVFQSPQVIPDDLALCYPLTYYTHHCLNVDSESSVSDNFQQNYNDKRVVRRIREQLREAIQARVKNIPIKGLWGILGKLFALSSRMRVRAFYGYVEDDFLPRIDGCSRALEVGCGTGNRMLSMKKLWNTEGVEWDPKAADIARRLTKCVVWEGDFMNLPLPPEAYGLILLNHVFEHLYDPVGTLQKIINMLVPGGRVVIVYPNLNSLGASMYGCNWYPWDVPRHLIFPSMAKTVEIAKEMGFKVIVAATSNNGAERYFAISRDYRLGNKIDEYHPKTQIKDKLLSMLELMLIKLGFNVGEEIKLVLQKTDSI